MFVKKKIFDVQKLKTKKNLNCPQKTILAKYCYYIWRSADGNMVRISLYGNILKFFKSYHLVTLVTNIKVTG